VKDVYAIFDAPPQGREQLILVLPAGKNAHPVADKLTPMVGKSALQVEQSAVVIQVDGRGAQRQPAAARPDLATALAKSDAPVVFAVTIPQEIRNLIPPEMPQRVGGADLTPIQDGFMWACVELGFTPDIGLHGVARMDSADNAKAAIAAAKTTLEHARDEAVQRGRPEGRMIGELMTVLVPEIKGDQIVVGLSSAQLDKSLAELGPSMREARQQAKRVASASQMRQLLQGIMIFAQQNGQATPARLEDLDQIFKSPGMIKMLTTNPQRPELTPGYVYVKQDLTAPDRVMIYEAYDTWKDGINVGYTDGHVEWIADEALFLKELKASGAEKK
jgi:prepilin-type processing-associated H-X9-DG protein